VAAGRPPPFIDTEAVRALRLGASTALPAFTDMIASMGVSLVQVVVAAAVLLLASVFASKAAGRFGVPALLLFLAVGMLAGSDGPGGLPFDNPGLAQALGIVALAFILFGGGLDTSWTEVRPVAAPAVALATLGVLVTAGLTGWFASWLLGLSPLEGLLLGAIVSSTDAAAVFAVLRSRQVRLPPRLNLRQPAGPTPARCPPSKRRPPA